MAHLFMLGLLFAGGADKDWKDVPLKDLGIEPFKEVKDAKSGFLIGGKNATDSIAKLTHINGRTIEKLEEEMRPGAASTKGFLGKEESLLKILEEDNALVVDKLGLTHQELARHLLVLGAIAQKKDAKVLYHGRKLALKAASFRGFVMSPFKDGTKANTEVTITNEAGKTLSYSLMVPIMVERYGFYEGHGTPYRVDPRRIIEVLDFLAKK